MKHSIFRRKTRHACQFSLGFMMMVFPWLLKGQDPFSRVTESVLSEEAGRFLTPSWGDFDDDGWVDLFVTRKDGGPCRLFRNMADGTFEMVEQGEFADSGNVGHAGCWADYDNDGNLDVLITRWGGDSQAVALYRGNGSGGFDKITSGDIARPGQNACSASWGDYNLDGYVDLHVGNYDERNWLFRNDGDGTFSSINAGIVTALSGRSICSAWTDYQADGYPDLFVGNSGLTQAYLFYGGMDGQFTRVAGSPPANDSSGYWMGADWGDYDNDGDQDLYVTSYNGMDRLYMNEGDGTFSVTRGVMPSVGNQTLHPTWGDYDNDGWLDLYVSCGNTSAARSKLYRNLGDGSFEDITDSVTVSEVVHSGGCCWGDYDNDGFLDLFVARGNYNSSRENALFHNNGNDNSWIKIRLVGSGSARCGIGAKVRVLAHIGDQNIWQLREISGGSGTGGSQNGLIAHFGLGNADMVETLRIEWPSGAIQELGPMIARQSVTVTEPPRISSINLRPEQSVELHVSAWPGQQFEVEASSDLSEWSSIGLAEVGPDRLIQFEDTEGEDAIARFFRLTIPKLQSVAQFEPPDFPEGMTIDSEGNAYVGMSQTGEIWKIDPDGTSTVMATLPGLVAGLCAGPDGAILAGVSALFPEPNPDLHGIWKVFPDGSTEVFSQLPIDSLINDVIMDSEGRVYVTDSAGGRVFLIGTDGAASEWLSSHPYLLGNPEPPPPQPYSVGANGIAFVGDQAYVCNTDLGLIIRIPVEEEDGTAGEPEIFLEGPAFYGSDGLRADANGNLYIANVMQTAILRVTPGGYVETLATAKDGLDSPSTVCFGKTPGTSTRLYIANYAIVTSMIPGGIPRPGLVWMDAGVSE